MANRRSDNVSAGLLRRAREPQSWIDRAKALRSIASVFENGEDGGQSVTADLAQTAGLSPELVRQHLNALSFVEAALPERQADAERAGVSRINALRTLHRISEDLAASQIEEVLTGRVSVRQLQQLGKSALRTNSRLKPADRRAYGRMHTKEVEGAVVNALSATYDTLFNVSRSDCVLKQGSPILGTRIAVDLEILDLSSQTKVWGIEIKMLGKPFNEQRAINMLAMGFVYKRNYENVALIVVSNAADDPTPLIHLANAMNPPCTVILFSPEKATFRTVFDPAS